MNPVLALDIGGVVVYTTSYRFFFMLAATATIGLGLLVAARSGLPWRRSLACISASAMAVPVGARLLDVVTKPDLYANHPELVFSTDLSGFSMYGGLLLAAGVGVVACRVLRLDLARMADSLAPGLAVGIALIRIGCFEAGCCFGVVSDLPWAVTFPAGSEAHLYQVLGSGWLFSTRDPLPVHPTQLYETGAALLGALLASWLLFRGFPGGTAFLAFASWYSGFRLLNHWLRVPGASLTTPDWFYSALYSAIAAIALTALLVLRARAAVHCKSAILR